MALVNPDNGGTPVTGGGGGYPPPAHVIAGTYYDANWNEVNADGSPKTGSSGVTYRQVVDTDGSLSGVPGATVQVSSTGSVSIISRPSTGGGGGGGAVSQAGRYSTHVDTTGAITGIPGATYQEDSFDGSITIVNRPSATTGSFANPLDKNNDGLNDSTGWANGVFKDSSSPSGFYYASNGQYIPVTPDGAPYTGPDLSGGGSQKTWNGTGPDGRYGTWILGPDGMPKTYLGDPRTPSNASAASSGTPRVSTGSSSGGGSSASTANAQIAAAASAASDAARAAQQAAHDAWQGNENEAQRNWQAAQNAIDRALKLTSDRAQFELTRTGLVQQQTKDMVDAAKQVADLISSTDPIKYRAFLAAGGGDIWNGLIGGGTAVSDNANLGAARTLRAMDNPTHIPTWDEIMAGGGFSVTNPPTLGANGVAVGGSGAGGVGNTPATGGGVQVGYGNDTQNTNTGAGGNTTGGVGNAPQVTLTSEPTPVYGQRVLGSSPSGGWEIDPTTGLPAIDPTTGQMIWNPNIGALMPTVSGGAAGFGNFDLGQQIGQPMTVGQRNAIANTAYTNYAGGVLGDQRPISITDAQLQNALGTSNPGAAAAPTVTPGTYNTVNTAPAGTQVAGGVANGTHIDAATGRLVPNVTTTTVPQVSRFAGGGVMVGGGMAVTGDSHTGRPNEEMVINLNPDPRDRIAVVPMDRIRQMGMGAALQSVMGRRGVQVGGSNVPYAADGGIFGADSILNPITPEDQPYLDRIQAIRDATDFSAWNPFRSDYFQRDPTIRSADELSVQAARGIPQASLVSYAQRYALPGIGRGALRIGV